MNITIPELAYVWLIGALYLGPADDAIGNRAPKDTWVKHERVWVFASKEKCLEHLAYLKRNPIWTEQMLVITDCIKVVNHFKETLE